MPSCSPRPAPCVPTWYRLLPGLGLLAATILLPGALMAGFHQTRTADAIQVGAQPVQSGAAGHLTIDLQFPAGYHLNPLAPLSYRLHVTGTGIHVAEQDQQFNATALALPLTIPFQAAAGTHQAILDTEMTFYFCRADNTGVCAMQTVRWLIPLYTVVDGAAIEPIVSYTAEAPILQKQW